MNVTIISCFRNAVGPQMERYFCQIDALANLLAKRKPWTHLSLVLGYGDSTDGTGEMLFEAAADSIGAHLIDVSHGGPVFSSIEDPQRFKQLAFVGNKLLANVPADADVVGIVESDLIWEAIIPAKLIHYLGLDGIDAVAPLVLDSPPANTFYDSWGFRKDGVRFTKEPPYHASLAHVKFLHQLDSAGSMLFMRGDIARKVRFCEENAIVGLCADITALGGKIWLDADSGIYHP